MTAEAGMTKDHFPLPRSVTDTLRPALSVTVRELREKPGEGTAVTVTVSPRSAWVVLIRRDPPLIPEAAATG